MGRYTKRCASISYAAFSLQRTKNRLPPAPLPRVQRYPYVHVLSPPYLTLAASLLQCTEPALHQVRTKKIKQKKRGRSTAKKVRPYSLYRDPIRLGSYSSRYPYCVYCAALHSGSYSRRLVCRPVHTAVGVS
jgi:hypothetical protein